MISLAPNVEVWGHEDARVSGTMSNKVFSLIGHAVFKNVVNKKIVYNGPPIKVTKGFIMRHSLATFLEYTFSMDIKPTGKVGGFGSIIHFTRGGLVGIAIHLEAEEDDSLWHWKRACGAP